MEPEKILLWDLSTEAPLQNFRPGTQHLLYKADEHFDNRLGAYNKCNNFLQQEYEKTCADLHLRLFDLITDDYLRAMSSKTESIYVSCVTSSLSDVDRNNVIDDMICSIDLRLSISISEVDCLKCPSAHDFYVHVAESYRQKVFRQAYEEKFRGAKSRAVVKNSNSLSHLILEAPILALSEILSESGGSSTMMIVLRHVERLHVHVFGEIIEMMKRSDLKAHFVVFCAAQCPLPLRLDKSASSLICVTLRATCSPLEFYDEFMGKVLGGCEMPVTFPPKIINWLHEKFWRSNNCVHSVWARISMCLSFHFEERKSLLAFFQDYTFLKEMKLYSKSLNSETNSVSLLLALMDENDLGGTGLSSFLGTVDRTDSKKIKMTNLSKVRTNKTDEVAKVAHALRAATMRINIYHALFTILKTVRDNFLPPGDKAGFCSDILWAALTNEATPRLRKASRRDESSRSSAASQMADYDCTLLADLLEETKNHLKKLPLNYIQSTIESFKDILLALQTELDKYISDISDAVVCDHPLSSSSSSSSSFSHEEAEQHTPSGSSKNVLDVITRKMPVNTSANRRKKMEEEKQLELENEREKEREKEKEREREREKEREKEKEKQRKKTTSKDLNMAKLCAESKAFLESSRRFVTVTEDLLGFVTLVLDEVCDEFRSLDISPSISYVQLVKKSTDKSINMSIIVDNYAGADAAENNGSSSSSSSSSSSHTNNGNGKDPGSDSAINNKVTVSLSNGTDAMQNNPVDSTTLLLPCIVENALLDFTVWLENTVDAVKKMPWPNKIPGIFEMSDEAADDAIRVCDSNIRSRYVNALADPELYLGSKNIPDVCVLIEKATNCVSSETAYDWYDHFKKECQEWPVKYKIAPTDGRSSRKVAPASHSKTAARGAASSSSSSSSSSAATAVSGADRKKKRSREDDDPSEGLESAPIPGTGPRSGPSSGPGTETAQNTVLHRCRFAKAMKDLEKSGIVKLRTGGTVVTRQIYTWISND